jgi:hypothetical protein
MVATGSGLDSSGMPCCVIDIPVGAKNGRRPARFRAEPTIRGLNLYGHDTDMERGEPIGR